MLNTITPPKVSLRFYVSRDALSILDIDRRAYPADPLGEERLRAFARSRDTIVKVVELPDATIIGYAIYELHSHCIEVHRLAVAEEYRRQGVGRKIVEPLTAKVLRPDSVRAAVVCDVGDDNLPAHLFLRGCGFTGRVLNSDTYRFTFER